jgi:hypothetical protein
MRIFGAVFAVLLTVPAGAGAIGSTSPSGGVARAHHCQPATEFVTDEESRQAAPFELGYEFKFDPPKAFLAAWCAKDAPASKGISTLFVWGERPDHPLRSWARYSPEKK